MYVKSKHVAHSSSPRVTRGVWMILAALVLGVWLPALSYMTWRSWRENRPDVLPRIDLNAGHNFIYDLTRLAPSQSVWFTYPLDSERIRLALQKDSSGSIRTVVASCTACYSFRKEHEFKEGQLMCGRCRHAMRLGDQNEKLIPAKGCVAVPVAFSVDKQLLTVQASDIEKRLRELESSKNQNQQ